jgi:hypothetical protein
VSIAFYTFYNGIAFSIAFASATCSSNSVLPASAFANHHHWGFILSLNTCKPNLP